MDNLWTIMPALITASVVIFVLTIVYRIVYIRAYRAGASVVLEQWKKTLEEEITNEEHV